MEINSKKKFTGSRIAHKFSGYKRTLPLVRA